jgi:hypothetical protein
MSCNYCFLQKNNIYEQIYELLEECELTMNNRDHYNSIKFKIDKYITSNKFIQISENYSTIDELFEELMVKIVESNNKYSDVKQDNLQGNTILSYADDNIMYEIVYLEDVITTNISDANLNQLATISNVDISAIYGDCAIIKTSYENNILSTRVISIDDIKNLIMNNFYHIGVMINTDETMLEVMFIGDNPNSIIGPNFKQLPLVNMYGLTLVCYQEESNIENKVASKLIGNSLSGRVFITTLCAISNKRFWSLSKNSINNLLKLLDDKESSNLINKEIMSDKLKNPFFLIKKYCS